MSIFYKKLRLLGLSFKTADIALRESLSSEQSLNEFIESQVKQRKIKGAFSLSTCNRVEICYEVDEHNQNFLNEVLSFFNIKNAHESYHQAIYQKSAKEVVEHLFKVASSLDSLVIGEPQITAQLKQSYKRAQEKGMITGDMHKFLQRALSVSKKIKSDTNIGKHAISISYVAVELIKKVFEDFNQCNVLLLGAGEMAELCLKHLRAKNVKSLSVANRSLDNAVNLAASYGASTIDFDNFKNTLHQFDIVITSTAAKNFLIQPEDLKLSMKRRKNKPVFLVDISVPRNINPDVEKLDEVYLYNVDDLEKISTNNQNIRYDESLKAHLIIEEEVEKFLHLQEQEMNKESIVSLKKQYKMILDLEMKKLAKSLNIDNEQILEKLSKTFESIEKKLLANPINYVKSKPSKDNMNELSKIFKLHE